MPMVLQDSSRIKQACASRSKLLVVDQRGQAFAAYEHGSLVRWGPVSSGRAPMATPADSSISRGDRAGGTAR
jgi:hypothetical protein